MAVTEGKIEGNCLPGRRRTASIDDVRRWTEDGLPTARRIALDRLCQSMAKQKHCSAISTALQRLRLRLLRKRNYLSFKVF